MRVMKYFTHPLLVFQILAYKGFMNWMPDKMFLSLMYRARMGKRLNLKKPKTFNEKIQWLKLYDRNPKYTSMVDKNEAKKYVASIIGNEYIIPTLGLWNNADEIDFDNLPNQFVLKCTHDSGGIIICKDKKRLNIKKARAFLNNRLKISHYYTHREWPYKNVLPRIIAEEYMEDSETSELRDYKFFTFWGEPKALFIATDRGSQEETKFDFFDMEFNHLPFTNGHPNASVMPSKPKAFDEMKTLASKLSQNIPHVRVDFYEVNGRIYFGELTFSHWSGMMPFDPPKWDKIFGKWLRLPEKHSN